jgi:hypothetical protein
MSQSGLLTEMCEAEVTQSRPGYSSAIGAFQQRNRRCSAAQSALFSSAIGAFQTVVEYISKCNMLGFCAL